MRPRPDLRQERWRRFAREAFSERGTVAIEFALIAPIFLTLLIATVETALIFFAQQTLQTAATQSARQIMTGQAQAAQTTAAQFKQSVCSQLTNLFDCANLVVTVQNYTSFSALNAATPLKNAALTGGLNSLPASFDPGVGGDIEVVQLFYPWPVVSAPIDLGLANVNGTHLLIGTAAFRNEPF